MSCLSKAKCTEKRRAHNGNCHDFFNVMDYFSDGNYGAKDSGFHTFMHHNHEELSHMKRIMIPVMLFLIGIIVLACANQTGQFAIHFESDGVAVTKIMTDGQSTITLPTPPDKLGHTFEGWYFDLGQWEDKITETRLLEMPINQHVTVFAYWTAKSYTIEFDVQGGELLASMTALFGENVPLPTPVKQSHRFVGWYQNDAMTVPFDGLSMPAHDITLYASWSPYVDVTVTLDPSTGTFFGSRLDTEAPLYDILLTTHTDATGASVTALDQTATAYRWFYKLFLSYDATLDVYEIVAVDQATANIADLTLPAYDVVIAVHDSSLDQAAYHTIQSLTATPETSIGLLIRTQESILSNFTKPLELKFYEAQLLTTPWTFTLREPTDWPDAVYEGHVLMGWSMDEAVLETYPGFTESDEVSWLQMEAMWRPFAFDAFVQMIEDVFAQPLNSDVLLPLYYGEAPVIWESNRPEVLTADGHYTRPYEATSGFMTAQITSGNQTFTETFAFHSEGYKTLDIPLAAGYIYRGFNQVETVVFETLDIIYTAFVTAQADGTLHGTNVLNQVSQYIMPEARRHGNYVIMSIAPDSAWSDIASSETNMATFAAEIVQMINTHGFDGVDIDWEFPTTSEAPRFTRLMQVVHAAVKQNNPHHLVTAALGGGMWLPARYDLEHSMPYIDYANIMTYSLTSANGQYHNPLHPSFTHDHPDFAAGRTLISASVSETVTILHETYGVPYEKMIIGVAFYGIKQVRSYDASTNTFGPWVRQGSVFYHHIADHYMNHPDYTTYYDETAQVPYILKNDGTVFISYDDTRSIYAKSAFIIAGGLGGMMYWEHGTDLSGALIRAVRSSLGK